jgi:uncharacterized protein
MARNVLGGELVACSLSPLTGFYRDGCCSAGPDDQGMHLVCAELTEDFLVFSKAMGNDLSTPVPEYRFPGLKPGDRWCLCLGRWIEALEAGVAPKIFLEATNEMVIEWVDMATLKAHGV